MLDADAWTFDGAWGLAAHTLIVAWVLAVCCLAGHNSAGMVVLSATTQHECQELCSDLCPPRMRSYLNVGVCVLLCITHLQAQQQDWQVCCL